MTRPSTWNAFEQDEAKFAIFTPLRMQLWLRTPAKSPSKFKGKGKKEKKLFFLAREGLLL
jgi:hypothetical protein